MHRVQVYLFICLFVLFINKLIYLKFCYIGCKVNNVASSVDARLTIQ